MKTDFILLDEAKDYSNKNDYPFGEKTNKIIGACMEVHFYTWKRIFGDCLQRCIGI